MARTLSDRDWVILLHRIQAGKCTPFLGAGVNSDILPLGSEIAKQLAETFQYPLEDCLDLARVSQFMAITYKDAMFPKEQVQKLLEKRLEQWQKTVDLPDFFNTPGEPLGVLASLPIPIYITTNYDNLMFEALSSKQKDPKRDLCRWNKLVRDKSTSVFDSAEPFEPTTASPVVFHLHGCNDVLNSLVLTEDDYLDFLVNFYKDGDLLPPRIQQALAETTLLFIGYRLADWDFRVLFRWIDSSVEKTVKRISIAVQLPPEGSQEEMQEAMKEYLVEYFDSFDVRIYWGTAKQFAEDLRERWELLET